jgi:NAD(P)-dependent dehydrogenase (short-subunit alcohol dehydrogenase family)
MNERPVTLITGATGGLGRVLAPALLEAGYDLALLGSSQLRLATAAAALHVPAGRHFEFEVNLRDADAVDGAIEAVYEHYGRVDALAHLVGGWTGGFTIADSDDDPYASMIDQHFWTPLNVVRALSPRMVAAGHGRIVAVSSPLAARPTAGMSAYGVGKAALEALFGSLARELADTGVTANLVRVRTIDTAHARDAGSNDSAGKSPSKADWTTPEEICAAIRYLFSDDARVVNGETLGLHSGR